MRDIYIRSKADPLHIGRRGENLASRVHLAKVPAGGQTVAVFVRRNRDSVAYPASNTEITDTEIIWTVTSVDTGKSGRGKVQCRFSDAETGKVVKTEIYDFIVGPAIDTEVGPAPDPYESIADRVADLVTVAQTAVRDAESEAARSETYAGQAVGYAETAQEARDEVLSAEVVLSAESDGDGTVTVSARIGG